MKKIIKSGIPIIVTYLLSYIILIISALIYNLLGYNNLDYFLYNISPHIINIYYIIIILYLYKNNKQKEKKLTKYFPQIYLGISIAIFLNMIIFKLNPQISTNKITIPTAIISSGIIGPIYEEIVFRYIFYNRLKKFNNKNKSLCIATIVFAIIHLNPIKIIYAFILGLILNIIYEKDKNILSPILIHVAANTIVIFLYEYNTYILFLSFINLLISIKIITQSK